MGMAEESGNASTTYELKQNSQRNTLRFTKAEVSSMARYANFPCCLKIRTFANGLKSGPVLFQQKPSQPRQQKDP